MMVRNLPAMMILALTACKPPATDDMAARGAKPERVAPSAPIDSPDTENAVWADSRQPGRILYGNPGEPPLIALSCNREGATAEFQITRFVEADAEASALMAMIGNGHMARMPVEAEWNDRVWLWQGRYAADNPDLDVLSGPRQVELTIPGAGSVILNPSQRPGQLLDQCRRQRDPVPEIDPQSDLQPE